MSAASKLNKASGYVFLFGFFISKLQFVPVVLVSTISRVLSSAASFLGYGLWFFACHFNPALPRLKQEWFGFAQLKQQYLYSSILGLIASALGIAAIFLPVLIIPTVWIILGSNIVWTIAEYHKLKNPHKDEESFSSSYQDAYFSYSITMSTTAFVIAAATTLAFVFPVISVPVIILSTIIGTGLGILSFHYWLDFSYGNHQPDTPLKGNCNLSYTNMNNTMGISSTHKAEDAKEPEQIKNLLNSRASINPNNVLSDEDSLAATCNP